jgi:succinyl-CoA synthetase alpha subunit
MTPFRRDAEVLVQGITGREGIFHSRLMKEYGTRIRAGVTPGKGGTQVDDVPVFNSIREAIVRFPMVNVSILFVPAPHCKEAVLEAVENGVECIVVITEGVPQRDTIWLIHYARCHGVMVIGPNCPGAILPPRTKLGIMPAGAFALGNVGLVSRSGTLTYEVGDALRRRGLGVSIAIGIGGDPIVGTTLSEVAELFQDDLYTDAVVVLGEIGGNMEEELAERIESGAITKPVISFIAGQTAPPGKKMGHAGAILQSGSGTAHDKILALETAGVSIAKNPWEIPDIFIKKGKK